MELIKTVRVVILMDKTQNLMFKTLSYYNSNL